MPRTFRIGLGPARAPPGALLPGTTPEEIAVYWRTAVVQSPAYNGEVENLVVIFLNTRRRIIGHHYVATGTLAELLSHPREVFRAAILAAASAIILGHNHPSGDPTPSEGDIRYTRDLVRAGDFLKLQVLDHVVIGVPDPAGNQRGYVSLRELGYFF